MKIIFSGSTHTLIHLDYKAGNPAPSSPVAVRQTNGKEVFLQVIGPDNYYIPAGEYEAESIPNPFVESEGRFIFNEETGRHTVINITGRFITIKGTRIGSSIEALLQWTGPAWGEAQIQLFENDGSRIYYSERYGDEGEYTLAEQQRRIDDGRITSPEVIAEHYRLVAEQKGVA